MKYDQFFTQVRIDELHQIDSFEHNFGFIGSCFSDHMHQRFRYHGLAAWMSPYGTTYNPISITNQILDSIDLTKDFTLFSTENTCFYWETSHKLVRQNPSDLKQVVDDMRLESHNAFQRMDTLFITLGTAWVYELNSTGLLVANCHKIPSTEFRKRLLSLTEITNSLHALLSRLNQYNPLLNVVFTVSPVRHVREGLVENSRSKAILIEACHQVVTSSMSAAYFPSYELLIDEFRDYRFFEKDGVHPTEFAIDLVFEKLKPAFFSEALQRILTEVAQIRHMEQHRFSQSTPASAIEKHNIQLGERKARLNDFHKICW